MALTLGTAETVAVGLAAAAEELGLTVPEAAELGLTDPEARVELGLTAPVTEILGLTTGFCGPLVG